MRILRAEINPKKLKNLPGSIINLSTPCVPTNFCFLNKDYYKGTESNDSKCQTLDDELVITRSLSLCHLFIDENSRDQRKKHCCSLGSRGKCCIHVLWHKRNRTRCSSRAHKLHHSTARVCPLLLTQIRQKHPCIQNRVLCK